MPYSDCDSPSDSDIWHDRAVLFLFAANLLLVLGTVAFAGLVFEDLPDRFPVHFDLHGNPNRWANKESGEWFFLSGVGAFSVALLVGLALLLPRIPPRYWNVPNKEAFLALSKRQRWPVVRSTVVYILVLALLTGGLFFTIQIELYCSAIGAFDMTHVGVIMAIIVLMTLYTVGWVVHFYRLVGRLTLSCL